MAQEGPPDAEKIIRDLEVRLGRSVSNREILDMFETHIRPSVDDADGWHVLDRVVNVAITAFDDETSIAARRKVSELWPNPVSFVSLGRGLLHGGYSAEAKDAFDKAIDIAIGERRSVAYAVKEQLWTSITSSDLALAERALERLFTWYNGGGRSMEDGRLTLDMLPRLQELGVSDAALEEYKALAKTGVKDSA